MWTGRFLVTKPYLIYQKEHKMKTTAKVVMAVAIFVLTLPIQLQAAQFDAS